MSATILVAFDDNRLIGDNGKLPWHIPNDLKFFKRITQGHPIIMGRKTWDSLPIKPLPRRMNIVLTRDASKLLLPPTDSLCYLNDVVAACNKFQEIYGNAFIIGGAQVYELALKLGVVDRVIVSRIKGSHQGDTYFPPLLEERWNCKPFGTAIEGQDDFELFEFFKKK